MDVPNLEEKMVVDNGPKIRLLFCMKCKSLEELPDFEGPADQDHLLQILSEKHTTTDIPHQGQLMRVPVSLWSVPSIRAEITKRIHENGNPLGAGLGEAFYTSKATFSEDAMTCWKKHLRPKGGCPDYGSESKLLLPDTAKERKALGLAPVEHTGAKNYLCQFCPVHTHMVTKAREKAGAYK